MGSATVVSADSELNRFVLKNEMKLFEPGWPISFKKVVGQNSLVIMVRNAHKHAKSTVLSFFTGERLRTVFMHDIYHIASRVMSSWKEGHVISAKGEASEVRSTELLLLP